MQLFEGYDTNISKICKYCVQDRSHNQILVEIFFGNMKLVGVRRIAPLGANPSICVRHSPLTRRPGRQFAKAKITNTSKILKI